MLSTVLYLVVLLVSKSNGCLDSYSAPLVTTKEGLVRGAVARSATGRPFCSFKGIPYAQAPVGPLRFQPPRRHAGWEGEHDGTAHGDSCPQVDIQANSTLRQSEDCLFVNVYTPRLLEEQSVTSGLSVMVFIHGGGYFAGHGDEKWYGPKYFMDENVVLVTFNYRLGALGFFTTLDHHAPGNYALLDNVMLLRWVQDNIGSFGGNPHSVTVFGESAGGSSVSILVLSPLTRGLFHRAISQSGSALASWALVGRQKGSAEALAKSLNCSTNDVVQMVECIRRQPYQAIVENTKGSESVFQPRVDLEADLPLMPDDPYTLLERGDFNQVQWMNGITAEEGSTAISFFTRNETLMAGLNSGSLLHWQDIASITSGIEPSILDCDADATTETTKVRDFYNRNGSLSDNNLLPLAQLTSDRKFVVQLSAESRLASRHTSVYKYVLDHTGPGRLSFADLGLLGPPGPDFGPTHGDDLMYLFNNDVLPLAEVGTPAYTMIRFMVNLWTNFARTGRPKSNVLPMPEWPAFNEESQQHMRLNSQPTLGERLFEDRVNFWQTVHINEPWRHPVERSCADQPSTNGGY